MTVKERYASEILTSILKDYLVDGTVPTADQMLENYETYTQDHPDLAKPFILDTGYTVEENSESSATSFNSFFEQAQMDLRVTYRELWDRTKQSIDLFERWCIELQKINADLVDLNSRIDNLLILRLDTAGYFNYVEDNIVDLSKTDVSNTTALVDSANHMIILNDDIEDISVVNTNTIDAQSITFTMLTRQGLVSSRVAPGAPLENAMKDVNTHWQHRAYFNGAPGEPVSGELKVKISSSATDISMIELVLHSSNFNSDVIVSCQYSDDNYNWYNLPTDLYTQSANDRAIFVFPTTSMSWVKFTLTKTGPDNIEGDNYVYEFGASAINLYATAGYSTSTGNLYYSKYLSAYDADDNRVDFNKIALHSCEELPENTGIKYWAQASDGTNSTEWLRIDPFNRESPVVTTVLELGKLLDYEEEELVLLDKTDSDSTDFFEAYTEFIESDNIALVGSSTSSLFSLSQSDGQNLIDEELYVYRNVGPRGGGTTQVRDCYLGWEYNDDESFIQTKVVVFPETGMDIDLGGSVANINGQKRSGQINIPQGINTFRTAVNNIAELSSYGPFDTETEVINADPLYPFNHKAIIEGVLYSNDYEDDKLYTGADIYCQAVAQRVSIFDLLNNIQDNDYRHFAIDINQSGSYVFLVRFDPEDTNLSNENVTIYYKTKNNIFNRIRLKAQLSSSDTTRTPKITGWRLMLGA